MSEISKTVRISFRVDLDEVPLRISALLKETHENVSALATLIQESATSLDSRGGIQEAYESVDSIRREMMKLDLRLEDCGGLLASYQSALAEMNRPLAPEEAKEVTEEQDE